MSEKQKKLLLALCLLFAVNMLTIVLVGRVHADLYKRGASGATVSEIQKRLNEAAMDTLGGDTQAWDLLSAMRDIKRRLTQDVDGKDVAEKGYWKGDVKKIVQALEEDTGSSGRTKEITKLVTEFFQELDRIDAMINQLANSAGNLRAREEAGNQINEVVQRAQKKLMEESGIKETQEGGSKIRLYTKAELEQMKRAQEEQQAQQEMQAQQEQQVQQETQVNKNRVRNAN